MDIIRKININKKRKIQISIVIIISILAFLLFSLYIKSFANTATGSGSTNENVIKTINFLDGLIGTFPMLVLSVIKIVLLIVMTALSWIIGFTISGKGVLTLDNILFNDLPLINLDFNPQNAGDYSGFMGAIASSVRIIMIIAVVIQLFVLLITVIRFMTKSLAQDKAETKMILVNWVKGIGIMFGVLFFMFVVIAINNALVGAVRAGLKNSQTTVFKGITNEILRNALTNQGFGGITATFIYIAILAQTVFFYFYYLKRFIVISFLMMVAPLITATYSLDMIDDNKSQTLEFWTNKFLHTVFIQIFHVFIYVALIFPLVTGNANTEWLIRPTEISNFIEMGVLTVFGMLFFFKGEALLKKIFGLKGEGVQSSAAATMLVVDKVTKTVNKAIKARNNYKDTKAINDKLDRGMDKVKEKESATKTSNKTTNDKSDGKDNSDKDKTQKRVVSEAERKKMDDFKKTVNKTKSNFSAEDAVKERKKFNDIQSKQEKAYNKKSFGKKTLKAFARGTVAATTAFATTAVTAGLKNMDAIEVGMVAEKATKRTLENYDNLVEMRKAKNEGQIIPGMFQGRTEKGKEQIKEQYDKTVEKFANQNAQVIKDLENLTGTKLSSETEEGKDNQKAYFETLKNREKEVTEEFEKAKKELNQYLKKTLGDTASISEEIILRMQDELEEKKTIITKGMNEKVKEFVIKYKEKELIEMMHAFDEMTKRVNDKIVSEKEDDPLGRYSDVVSELPKAEERLKKADLLEDANKLDPEKEEDLEDAMYFDTIVRDVFKSLGRL
jgi:membrane protein